MVVLFIDIKSYQNYESKYDWIFTADRLKKDTSYRGEDQTSNLKSTIKYKTVEYLLT